MQDDKIILKGNKEGLNVIVNIDKFKNNEEFINALVKKLSSTKRFYKGAVIIITIDLKQLDEKEIIRIKDILFEELLIKDCIFKDSEEKTVKMFNGVTEGRTKFLRKTIRSGQRFEYSGNLVVVGNINPGAEVVVGGNIVVLGSIKGIVHAGCDGNTRAFIAAFSLQPQIMGIAQIKTRAPEDGVKPKYPEIAHIKNGIIVVEPYSMNKYN